MKHLLASLTLTALLTALPVFAQGYQGHGEGSVSEATLQKYAPKSIPPELTQEIEASNDISTPGLGLLSPDGKRLFFSWRITGSSQIWRIDGPQAFPTQLTGGEDGTDLKGITHDGRQLILSRDHKGNEYPRLYLQSVDGGPLKPIFAKERVIVAYLSQSEDGKYLYYRANDKEPTLWGIYKHDLTTGLRELLYEGKGYWFLSDQKPNGEMILAHALSNTATEYFLFNEKTKAISPLIGQGEQEDYYVQFAPQQGEYFVLSNKSSDLKRLYRYNGKDFKPITPEFKTEVGDFRLDKKANRLLVELNAGGQYRMLAYDARNDKEIKLPDLSDSLHSYFGESTPDGRYTIFGQSFYNKQRDSYVYDWQTQKLVQWTHGSSPEIDTSNYRPWKLEYYQAEDGTEIPMFVKRPAECENKTCPVVVSFHGGPEGQARPSFSPAAELFVQRGFVYVMPNVRGSSGYGKAWLNSDNGPKRLDVITDIRDCAIHIRKHWSFDGIEPKIGVMGGSYGGYSTLYAMTVFAGYYQAGVATVGMSSLVTFLENTAEHRRYVRESEYGFLKTDRKALEELSPINHIDQLQDPLLIIQGATDPRVPAGEAIQFQQALEKRGIPSDLVLFSDEGHGVRKRKNRTLSTGHTLNFFLQHLK